MEFEIEDKLIRRGDSSAEAIHQRLVATREMTEMTSKDLARACGVKYTTFISQEKAGSPKLKMMTYYLKNFGVDYNFILGGDPSRLPADVRKEIVAQLVEPATK